MFNNASLCPLYSASEQERHERRRLHSRWRRRPQRQSTTCRVKGAVTLNADGVSIEDCKADGNILYGLLSFFAVTKIWSLGACAATGVAIRAAEASS